MKKYLLILLMLSSANAVAALNKWVDENGKVHYSDQTPPANVKSQTLRSVAVTTSETLPAKSLTASANGVAATSAASGTQTIAEREAEWKKAQQAKKEAAEKAAKEQTQKEEKTNNCAMSQQNLRTLQAGIPISEIDVKGARSYLDDKQRQQRISKAQQDIGKWCK